jgi:hypothetical protein
MLQQFAEKHEYFAALPASLGNHAALHQVPPRRCANCRPALRQLPPGAA